MTLSPSFSGAPQSDSAVAAQQRVQHAVRLGNIGQDVGLAGGGDVPGKALSDFHGEAAQIALDAHRRLNMQNLGVWDRAAE